LSGLKEPSYSKQIFSATEMKHLPAIAGGHPIRSADNPIRFGSPKIGDAEISAISGCINRGWIGKGPVVDEFETAFAAFKTAPHAIAVSSCTAAIHLALVSLGIGPGDEVITPTLTYCATIHDIIHVGATPVLVDSDPGTLNLVTHLEAFATPRTKAIVVVHFAGRCCEMDQIMQFARDRGIFVIEDCAHAIEATYHGIPAGLIGDIGCFSFYPTKNMTTIEGGMVITRDAELAKKIRTLSQQGLSHDAWKRYSDAGYQHYDIVDAGFKYNMTDIQAAIGLVQLQALPERHRYRFQLWKRYETNLAEIPCLRPAPVDIEGDDVHALHLYTIQIEADKFPIGRDHLMEALTAENIGVGVHYVPIHLSQFYSEAYQWRKGDFPNSELVGARIISLPLGADLSQQDVDDVCLAFTRIYNFFYEQ
jgi:dTDP-4-amino-4,6-dideoxygalactose transaminase